MASTSFPVVVAAASGALVVAVDVAIDKIRWVGATTAGHQLQIQDGAGNAKFASVAPGGNYVESETFTTPLDSNGVTVPVLDSGTVYIYILQR